MTRPREEVLRELQEELAHLVSDSLPKVCQSCGRRYEDLDAFLQNTHRIPFATGLFQREEGEDGNDIIDLIRNCPCGSTLMVVFHNRRQHSPRKQRKRRLFDRLMHVLEQEGVETETARTELRHAVRNEPTPLLDHSRLTRDPHDKRLLEIMKRL
jgi:hypothetical protein